MIPAWPSERDPRRCEPADVDKHPLSAKTIPVLAISEWMGQANLNP